MNQPHDPYAALRHRDYVLFAVGGVIANIGSQMQSVAIGWELYERTGRAMSLGWVGLLQALPVIGLALPAGQLADRVDRRRIVQWAQLAAAVCSVGLAVVSWQRGPVGWMYTLLFLVAAGRAFHFPAGAALLPQLVPREVFSNAVTWRSSGFQVAAMVGPALGGLLIALWRQPAVVYLLGAGASLLFVVFVMLIRGRPQGHAEREPATWRSLAAGVGFVWRTKVVLAALALDLFAVLFGGAAVLLPVYAKDLLHVGPRELGWMRTAEAVGAFGMALLLAHLPPPRRAGRALLLAVMGFGLATILFGLSRHLWLSLLALGLIGALDNISVVIRHTLVQTRTPDAMRGRVSAVNSVFISASNELGGFESGLVAQLFGPVASVVSGGVGTMVVVVLAALSWPQIRRLGPLVDPEPGRAGVPVRAASGNGPR